MVAKEVLWNLPYVQLILFIVANLLLLAIAGWLWRQGDHEIWNRLEEKYRICAPSTQIQISDTE